jgi:hypothetical protein
MLGSDASSNRRFTRRASTTNPVDVLKLFLNARAHDKFEICFIRVFMSASLAVEAQTNSR